MKKIPLIISVLFIILAMAFSSCKRDDQILLPELESNDPVFYFTAELDGQFKEWTAGIDGQFMHTDWMLDNNKVKTFQGFLGDESCISNCEGSISFQLKDYDTDDGLTVLNQSIKKGVYPYKNNFKVAEESDHYRVEFDSPYDQDDPNFFWIFSDGSVASGIADPIHIYETPTAFYEPVFRVDARKRSTFHSRQLPIFPDDGIEYNIPPVNARLEFQPLSGNKVRITMRPEAFDMIPPQDLIWEITTGPIGNEIDDSRQTKTDIDNPLHTIELEVTEDTSLGATVFFNDATNPLGFATVSVGLIIEVDDNGVLTTRGTDFEYTIEEIPGGSKYAFATFELTYQDENGKTYSSALEGQNQNIKFEILELEPYDLNLRSQNTVKAKVLATECRLYAEDGSSILMKNGEGVIALAY